MKATHIFLAILNLVGASAQAQNDLLANAKDLDPVNVIIEEKQFKGRKAIRVFEKPDNKGEAIAVLRNSEFMDGTIELELAGSPRPGTDSTFRGFIGLAFRVKVGDTIRYDCFYIRPTNGRSSDQLRRNHSTQYISHPEYPWFRLRKENPGVYESYVDLVPAAWTKVKIVVRGQQAKLYIHDSEQPSLVVNDIKHPAVPGALALWIGVGTDGYFRNLRVTKTKSP